MSENKNSIDIIPDKNNVKINNIIPVGVESGNELIEKLRSMIDTKLMHYSSFLGKNIEDEFKNIIELAYYGLLPFFTQSGIAVNTEPTAFKIDVKRKLIGIAQTMRKLVQKKTEICIESMNAVLENDREGAGQVLSKLSMENVEGDVLFYLRDNVVTQYCDDAVKMGANSFIAYLISIDILLGAILINLPASQIPNAHKIRLGILTD